MMRQTLALWLVSGGFLVSPDARPAAAAEPAGSISSVAGNGHVGYAGDNGPARQATLNNPFDIAFDRQGNMFFSDALNHCIRKVDATTGTIATVAGIGKKGFSGDDGPADRAQMDEPYGIALDAAGNLYFADRLNRRVRKVDAKSGVISTLAGVGSKGFSGDDGPGAKAGLVEPNSVALDLSGKRLYIADVADHRVRVVDLSTGIIRTFAGNGRGRHDGDGGPATSASIAGARGVKVGPDGIVYVIERQGNTLRAIDPRSGMISTVAGTGAKGNSGDGGPALKATFNGPKELAVDRSGNIFIVDTENQLIRRIDAKSGVISTIAGNGERGPGGDGGPATSAQLARPHGVVVGPDGSVYIGDTENNRIRKVSP